LFFALFLIFFLKHYNFQTGSAGAKQPEQESCALVP